MGKRYDERRSTNGIGNVVSSFFKKQKELINFEIKKQMNLQERKLQIIDSVIRTSDTKIIEKLEKIISAEIDFWDELTEEQQASIDRGIKELNEGKGIPWEKVKKKYKKWL
jgi:hypothetical protein